MFNFQLKRIILFLVLVVFFAPSFVKAQFSSGLTLTVTPDFPSSMEEVTVKLSSSSFDLSRNEIVWFKNGEYVDAGIGKTKYIFNTGRVGSSDLIEVNVDVGNGLVLDNSIRIRPADVDLVWEARTYTPFLYKGKALSSRLSPVRIVATPNIVTSGGTRISPGNLVYKWKKDFTYMNNVSGYGKNILDVARLDILRDALITVEVSSLDGLYTAKDSVSLPLYETELVFYKNDPLLGVNYDNALVGDVETGENEITIQAVPYYFSTDDYWGNNLDYSWLINGEIVPGSEKDREVTFSRNPEEEGAVNLSLNVKNLDKAIQYAREILNIDFRSSGGIFFGN